MAHPPAQTTTASQLKSIITGWRSCAVFQTVSGSSALTTRGEQTPRGQWTAPHIPSDARHARDLGYEPEWTLARGLTDYAWLKTQEAQALGAQETMVVDL